MPDVNQSVSAFVKFGGMHLFNSDDNPSHYNLPSTDGPVGFFPGGVGEWVGEDNICG